MKKAISVILCISIIISMLCIGGFATDSRHTDCDSSCEFYPTIIIPGLGQSSVCVADENGDFVLDDDGNKISAFPAYIQLPEIIKRAAVPVIMSLIMQRDIGLSDAFSDIIELCFGINASDLNAQNTGNVIVEKFMYPYSECSEYEQEVINSHIPFHLYPTELPKDHLYYFCYNSFGNHLDITNELYDYIQMVKKQTGHSKINIVPISQGGTFANSLFEYYPDVANDLHKVIYIVPALDGSTIIGDVFNDRITFLNSDYLYHGFLENIGLLDNGTAKMIEVFARILPDEVIMECLDKGVKTLIEKILVRSTGMWALCPSGDYPSAAERYLSTPEMANIKTQTDKYYQSQLHSDANIQRLLDKGVTIFNVVQYDYKMINVGENWNIQNSDYIIHLDSTSMGAYAANIGETLPIGYVQKGTHCSNPNHNHISPDRVVDASAGLLPDTSFYFDGQRHDLTQHNDVILKLAMELIANDDIKDVYSSSDFPQFNIGRDVRPLMNLLEIADTVKAEKLSEGTKGKLDSAVAQANHLLNTTVCKAGDFQNAEKQLTAALVEAGAIEPEKEKDYSFFEKLADWLYKCYGTNGYSEMPLETLKIIFNSIADFFKSIFAK